MNKSIYREQEIGREEFECEIVRSGMIEDLADAIEDVYRLLESNWFGEKKKVDRLSNQLDFISEKQLDWHQDKKASMTAIILRERIELAVQSDVSGIIHDGTGLYFDSGR